MQFLRTIFWVVLAVIAVAFAFNNAETAHVRLWGDLILDTPLWMVALLAFLVGLIPGLIAWRTARWRLRRKLDAATRAFAPSVEAPTYPAPPLTPPPAPLP